MSFNIKKYRKLYYQKNKDKVMHCSKEYRKNNSDKIEETNKNYYLQNKDKLKAKVQEYKNNHKEYYKTYNKNYKKQHNKQYRKYMEEYTKRNKKRIKLHKQTYWNKNKDIINKIRRERIANDINYKLRCRLAVRISQTIKKRHKSKQIQELLGCSIEYFIDYIECQFDYDMNWKNYGLTGWHIDHIKPCVAFDLSKEDELKECFHHTNLQPLWAQDNWSKAAKVSS